VVDGSPAGVASGKEFPFAVRAGAWRFWLVGMNVQNEEG
jgi:hypothetical protein